MVFYWSLSDSKSPQVSGIVLNILSDLNNAVGWKGKIRALISSSSRLLSKPLGIVQNAQITFGIIVTFLLGSFSGKI